jgi:NAD(P)-dependent dehydrogenase (short-subunit alcohol dehydrogenase family)
LPARRSLHAAGYAASMYGLIALTCAASDELDPYGIRVHALGRGISQFHNAAPEVPRDLAGAVLYLCGQMMSGQIVNLEES